MTELFADRYRTPKLMKSGTVKLRKGFSETFILTIDRGIADMAVMAADIIRRRFASPPDVTPTRYARAPTAKIYTRSIKTVPMLMALHGGQLDFGPVDEGLLDDADVAPILPNTYSDIKLNSVRVK